MSDQIRLDDDGSLVEPIAHDAVLYQIDFGRKELRFYCREPNGKSYVLKMSDVIHMSSSNIAEENVLLDISLSDGDDINVGLVKSILPDITKPQKEFFEIVVSKLKNKQLKLLEFSPSYGGAIVLICKSVSFEYLK